MEVILVCKHSLFISLWFSPLWLSERLVCKCLFPREKFSCPRGRWVRWSCSYFWLRNISRIACVLFLDVLNVLLCCCLLKLIGLLVQRNNCRRIVARSSLSWRGFWSSGIFTSWFRWLPLRPARPPMRCSVSLLRFRPLHHKSTPHQVVRCHFQTHMAWVPFYQPRRALNI